MGIVISQSGICIKRTNKIQIIQRKVQVELEFLKLQMPLYVLLLNVITIMEKEVKD